MEITEVRVRQVQNAADRLKAFCTVTFDDQFVVRDIKVVEGSTGLFVSMPSRKATAACAKCGHRSQIRARFCEDCGARMPQQDLSAVDANGRSKLHRDIAHPITPEFREILQGRVLEAYRLEMENAPQDEYEPEVEAPVEEEEGQPAAEVQEVEEVEGEEQRERAASEYDDLIAGLRGASEVEREPRGHSDDRGYGNRGGGDRRGGERGRSESRGFGERPAQGESRGRGPAPRANGGDRGRGPREGDRGGRSREGGFQRTGGADGARRGRDAGPPRRTGNSQGVRYLRDEQPPRAPGSLPHGERMGENRPPQREPDREVAREPARDVTPRELPREAPRETPRGPARETPKGPPPSQISLKEADQRFGVDAGGEDEDAPFGAGL